MTTVDLIWAEGKDRHMPSQSLLHQHGIEVQPFGTLRLLPIVLSYEARLVAAVQRPIALNALTERAHAHIATTDAERPVAGLPGPTPSTT